MTVMKITACKTMFVVDVMDNAEIDVMPIINRLRTIDKRANAYMTSASDIYAYNLMKYQSDLNKALDPDTYKKVMNLVIG